MTTNAEVDWQRLDKTKFFGVGTVLFTGLTTCLFPLSVVKTRQMALDNAPRGAKGAYLTAQSILQHDGVRGLYRGFGTVIAGAIPGRIMYLSTLELMKSVTSGMLHKFQLSDTANVGMASFVAGGTASLVSHLVGVPVDVVAQRLMIQGGPPSSTTAASSGTTSSSSVKASSGGSSSAVAGASRRGAPINGLQLARQIIAQEGVRGLYRGFGASVATFVPNSAIWWGCYGAHQRLLWHQIDSWRGVHQRTEGEMVGVQAVAGVVTGFTAAAITNPLDVVKTRLQTRDVAPGAERPTFSGVVGQLVRTEGVAGFYRGLAPRMFSSAVWGTAMVSLYEFLKRLCVLPPPGVSL